MYKSGTIIKLSSERTVKVLIKKKEIHSLYKKVV